MAPSCLPRRDESNDVWFDLAMSCRISYDAPGLGEHIGASPKSLAWFYHEL